MRNHYSLPAAFALAFVVATLVYCPASLALDKVALVIGNGAYEKVPKLANPTRDAESVAQAFDRLGFAVVRANDSSLSGMRKAITDFGASADGASIAVVYYAGHGIEAGGENWLIPVDAGLDSNADAEKTAVSLRSISEQAAKARTLGLIILDACRDNPFKMQQAPALVSASETRGGTRSISRGLAPTDPGGNVLIAFAAKDGTVADDGDGEHSPFTTSLLRHIEAPGIEVTFLFRTVRDEVVAATKGRQQPYLYGSLSKDSIYLKPPTSDQMLAALPAIAAAPRQANKLFTSADDTSIVNAAQKLQLSPPLIQISAIDPGVPGNLRRFVGVWISKVGMNNGLGRQSMVIGTHVDAAGVLNGYFVWGPPTKNTWNPSPAGHRGIKVTISDDQFQFPSGQQNNTFKLLADGRLLYQTQMGQRIATNMLYPAWTLSSREHGGTASDTATPPNSGARKRP